GIGSLHPLLPEPPAGLLPVMGEAIDICLSLAASRAVAPLPDAAAVGGLVPGGCAGRQRGPPAAGRGDVRGRAIERPRPEAVPVAARAPAVPLLPRADRVFSGSVAAVDNRGY